MRIAIRYSKDQAMAKDLVHDTFLKVFTSIKMFDPRKGSIMGWMSRILINEALQHFRKNNRIDLLPETSFPDHEDHVYSILHTLEAEDILRLINTLPEGCRLIFNLYVIEGYKHKEIGQMLQITASASRAQLTRAKQLLRKLLSKKKVAV